MKAKVEEFYHANHLVCLCVQEFYHANHLVCLCVQVTDKGQVERILPC